MSSARGECEDVECEYRAIAMHPAQSTCEEQS